MFVLSRNFYITFINCWMATGSIAFAAVPVCCESGSTRFIFIILQLVLGLYWLYLKKLLEIVFCRFADTNSTQWTRLLHVDVLLLKFVRLRPEYFFLIIFITVIVTGLHFVLQNAQPVKDFTGSNLVNVEAPPQSESLSTTHRIVCDVQKLCVTITFRRKFMVPEGIQGRQYTFHSTHDTRSWLS